LEPSINRSIPAVW